MKTNLEKVTALNPCKEGLVWYKDKFGESDVSVETVINQLMDDDKFDWANWFIVRNFTHEQKVMYAIFSAEQVIGIYETKYPDDNRPRKAIEVAKAYLKNHSKDN